MPSGAGPRSAVGVHHEALDEDRLLPDSVAEKLLDLNDALERMEQVQPRPAQVVAHHDFGGLTHQEIAEVLEVRRRRSSGTYALHRRG